MVRVGETFACQTVILSKQWLGGNSALLERAHKPNWPVHSSHTRPCAADTKLWDIFMGVSWGRSVDSGSHKISGNIWCVWFKTPYSVEKLRRLKWDQRTDKEQNVKIGLEFCRSCNFSLNRVLWLRFCELQSSKVAILKNSQSEHQPCLMTQVLWTAK